MWYGNPLRCATNAASERGAAAASASARRGIAPMATRASIAADVMTVGQTYGLAQGFSRS